ncbi:MAG TPA: hypothetical protein VL068_10025, partial [Microthrixaceae bacterium]|nr:hypothetical protein [Microthrixaceae bacterium]
VAEGHLLVASTDAFLDGDGTVPTALRNAQLCEALVSAGIDEPLGPIATALVASERFSGQLRMPDRSDAVIALIHAAAPLLVGSRSEVWTEDLIGPVAKGIHRVGQGKGVGESLELKRSAAVALARVAPSLRFVGQPEVAEAAASTARRLWESVGNTAGTPGPIAVPTAGPSGQSSLLQKAVALRASVLAGSDGAVDDLLKFARSGNLGVLGAFEDTDGNPTGELAVDPAVIATRAATVMDLLVAQGPEGPVLLPSWSPYWFDKPVEAQRIRTAWGLVSYAVRWHGNRPAILWEIEPAAGIPMVDGAPAPESAPVLKAPGLDPDWSATGWAGEALLSPVTVSEQVIAEIAERATPRLSVQLGMKPKKK